MMYDKGKGKMNSAKGMNSYPDNPMPKPSQVAPKAGPGGNADQMKANKLLQKALSQQDSLRGKSGM